MNTVLRMLCLSLVLPLLIVAAEARRITPGEAMELVTSKVTPEYPAVAKQLNLSGTVEVEIVVGENGVVESAVPVSGSPVLTRPAADALKKWKFKPLQVDGAASRFQSVIKVNFTR
jgi:protein TonB